MTTSPATTEAAAEVLALEDRRFAAMVAKDTATLAPLARAPTKSASSASQRSAGHTRASRP